MAKILFIENIEALQENVSELLAFNNHSIIPAFTGKEGLKLAREVFPDIILSEVKLPDINGYQVLKQIKQKPETAGIPFVFLSAQTESREIKKALNSGVIAYVRKPFNEEDLQNVINYCIEGTAPVSVNNSCLTLHSQNGLE